MIHILINPPYKHLSKTFSLAKGYATRTRISIGGVQYRDTLIEQSPTYSNRTLSRCIIVGSAMEFIYICTYNEVHWSLDSSTCVVIMYGNT